VRNKRKSVRGCHLLLNKENYMLLEKEFRKIKINFTQCHPGYGSLIQTWLS
jgi:hypothetical protein